MLLSGDIGGTKTVLALIAPGESLQRPFREATFPSGDYPSLEAIIHQFLTGSTETISHASFGVAGPVVGERVQITNLPWVIDAAVIRRAFNIPYVYLLNDLKAVASAVPHLRPDQLAVINPGAPDPTGAIAVIAPGTGLGEAFLVWDGRHYQAHPTEGGHVSFAPGTPQQAELLAYLQPRFGHVSFERVCSGSGIPNLYDYLRDSGRYAEPQWLQEKLAVVTDRTPIIINAAQAGEADICTAVLDLFIDILGGEAGNMALKVLATGGVYLGGGIPPRILPQLQETGFMAAFMNKGRFKDLLARIPIYVIRSARVALYGAAYYAQDAMQHG
jgi:glucokinase